MTSPLLRKTFLRVHETSEVMKGPERISSLFLWTERKIEWRTYILFIIRGKFIDIQVW